MEDKGTVGAFTKQAKDSGMTVQEFAMKVKQVMKLLVVEHIQV